MKKMLVVFLTTFFGLAGYHPNDCLADGVIEQFSMRSVQENDGQETLNVFRVEGVAPWHRTTRVTGPNGYDEWHWNWWEYLVSYNYKEGMYYEVTSNDNSPADGDYTLQLYQDTSQPPVDTNTLIGFTKNELDIVDVSTATPSNYSYINNSTPTFSWTGITDETATPYYRIRIEDPCQSAVIFLSDRNTSTTVTVPTGFLDLQRSYRWRVETFDASDASAMNLSQSDWATFFTGNSNPAQTPLAIDFAFMRSRLKTNNRTYTQMTIGITGPSPEDVDIQIEGPLEGTSETYNLGAADYCWDAYGISPQEQLQNGTYRFTVTDNRAGGGTVSVDRTLQANWDIDQIYEDDINLDSDIYLDTNRPTITWSPMDVPLYWLNIYSADWTKSIYSLYTDQTQATVPVDLLSKNTAYWFRVDTYDKTDDPITDGEDNGNRGSGDAIPVFIVNDNDPASFSGTISPGSSGAGGPVYILVQDNPVLNQGEDYGFTMIADPAVDGWDYTIYNIPRETDLYIFAIYDADNSQSYSVGDFKGSYSSGPINLTLEDTTFTGYNITLSTEVLGAPVSGTVSCANYTTGTVYVGAFNWSDEDEPVAEVALTGGPGAYSIPNLPVGGSIYIKAYWDSDGLGSGGPTPLDQLGDHPSNPIIVGSSGNSGVNIDIETTGFITGRVTDADTGGPLANIHVYVDDSETGYRVEGTYTDNDGYYTFALPSGTYYVAACPRCDDFPYVNEYANSIEVTDPDVTTQNFSLSTGGTISGTVYESDGVTPIGGLWVGAQDWDTGDFITSTNTDSEGNYTLRVNPGSYKINTCASCNFDPYVDEYYDDTNWDGATEVVVTDGNDTPDIDFILSSGGTISGRALESDGVTPIVDLKIEANDWNTREYITGTYTDSDGNYSLRVGSGSYRISTCASCDSASYVDEYYDDTNYDGATEVVVTDGNDTPNIDFTLSTGGTISGIITDENGPIANLHIYATEWDSGDWAGGNNTASDGSYTIRVNPGNYRVRTCANCDDLPYIEEIYDDVTNWEGATMVTVQDSTDTPDIDFVLSQGGTISGTVTERGGSPLANLHIYATEWDSNDWIAGTNTESDGSYSLRIYAGNYRIHACATCNNQAFVNEYYNNTINFESAEQVEVNLDNDTGEIDFVLDPITGGDIDADGDVDLFDVMTGLNAISNTDNGSAWKFGDVDGDGKIGLPDIIDALRQQ